ncbi:hypothetical protein XFF6166_50010 [Xanthomonas citri pv. fuscans]|nr:hypothetical protein XFF6166_50010 [Xanthomonas citri pv. fuscans]SON99056.1 hypothetical protein XFF6960_120010 [Xanthomonas citri pv. fuscans]SOO04027.1 hypothetical protein XFF7767_210041 [Xanthomonas citri pv. fuscans]SOO09182.1 hypothetical protein XFF6970_320039 [Xanthomonas citri pv. fuscans]SOO13295.1 hypothetical protein XFF7766_150008 [Xanthomonas citri pv. fuscans]
MPGVRWRRGGCALCPRNLDTGGRIAEPAMQPAVLDRPIAIAPIAGNRAAQAMRRAPYALSALTLARITAADARLCAYGQGRCQARRRYHPSSDTISIPLRIAAAPF